MRRVQHQCWLSLPDCWELASNSLATGLLMTLDAPAEEEVAASEAESEERLGILLTWPRISICQARSLVRTWTRSEGTGGESLKCFENFCSSFSVGELVLAKPLHWVILAFSAATNRLKSSNAKYLIRSVKSRRGLSSKAKHLIRSA
jgi:hypothetical protein